MKLRNEAILIIGSSILILTALLYGHSANAWLDSFNQIEDESTRQDVERVLHSLESELTNLDKTADDWAAWDDTYLFMEDHNPEYLDSNLVDGTFISLQLNLMLFLANDGHIVYGRAFDLQKQVEIDLPTGLEKYLTLDSPLISNREPGSSVKGILMLDDTPMLAATRPILTSDKQGPVRGILLLGRNLDQQELDHVAQLTAVSFSTYPYPAASFPSDVQQVLSQIDEGQISTHVIDKDTIAGYALVRDVQNIPAIVIRVQSPRTIYTQARRGTNLQVYPFLLFSLATSVMILVLLDRTVLGRLSHLSRQIEEITNQGDPTLRVQLVGRDELSGLAGSINDMLGSLELAQAQREQTLVEWEAQTEALAEANQALQVEVTRREEIQAALQTLAHQQERLIETAQYLAQSLDVRQVLQRIGDGAKEILEADGCAIYLLEPDNKTLTPVVAADSRYKEEILAAPLQIDHSFTGQAIKSRRGLIFNNAGDDDSGFQIPNTPEEEDERIMVAPFIIDGEVVGAMCLDRGAKDFTDQDLNVAETFAAYAATTLKNAHTYDELQHEVVERRQAEEALRASEERYRNLFNRVPAGLYRTSADGQILEANQGLAEMLGFDNPEALKQYKVEQFIVDSKDRKRTHKLLKGDGSLHGYEMQMRRLDGRIIWVSDTFRVVSDNNTKRQYDEGTLINITPRKQAEKVQRALYQISQAANETHNLSELFKRVHQVIQELIPAKNFYVALYDPATSLVSFPFFIDQHDPAPLPRKLDKGLTSYVIRYGKPLLALPDVFDDLVESGEVESVGTPSVDWLGVPLKNVDKVTIGAMVVQTYDQGIRYTESDKELMSIVSSQVAMAIERKQAEEKLSYNAFHDELTSLPNRTLFIDRLGHALKLSQRRRDHWFAVLFLDLDRFKTVNDSLGHVLGDQLLISASRRLQVCLRDSDTVARFGGDEFVILLEDLDDSNEATRIAERILKEFLAPFNLAGHEVLISTSIGIVFGSQDYTKPEEVLRDADIAMYQAKNLGRSRYVIFNTAMRANVVAHIELENDLRTTIEKQELELYYQPILSLKSTKIIGFEALVRWNHPTKGLIFPSDFIPLAEDTGLIIPMGEWILRQACKQMSAWHKQFPSDPPLIISVNLSNKQFSKPELFDQIENALQDSQLDARYLRLEITESAIMENAELAIATLNHLRQLGVQVYIDDFGTGYSSLVYLHLLPINAIKIDRSFISGDGIEKNGLEIAQTIVRLAHDLRMEAIAEGVETAEQLEKLKLLECEYAQGYHISKCLNQPSVEELLSSTPFFSTSRGSLQLA